MVRDERVDDVGQQVDHPVARVDVKRLDPLAIDSHETLGGQAEVWERSLIGKIRTS